VIMIGRKYLSVGAVSLAALALAACGSGTGTYGNDYGDTNNTAAPTSAPAAAGVGLMTANSDLGTIVTDSAGMTVYMYDSDTQGSGESTCSGGCLSMWPPVPAGSGAPELTGVTGDVGTITATDGSAQLTLNGWPLYYYASDSAAGDTAGQGSGGVWWVLDATGTPVGK
jgi:predicted lipoprotein with Yx(FWY)xxD motif